MSKIDIITDDKERKEIKKDVFEAACKSKEIQKLVDELLKDGSFSILIEGKSYDEIKNMFSELIFQRSDIWLEVLSRELREDEKGEDFKNEIVKLTAEMVGCIIARKATEGS